MGDNVCKGEKQKLPFPSQTKCFWNVTRQIMGKKKGNKDKIIVIIINYLV